MGRKSDIDKLPEALRKQLHALLNDPALTIDDLTEQFNTLLSAATVDEAVPDEISRSAMGRYALKMKALVEKKQQAREALSFWTATLGDIPDGDFGRSIVEILRTLSFDISMAAHDGFDPDKVPAAAKMLKDLAIATERLEKAASENEKRDQEIRKRARQEAAEQLTEDLKGQDGLTVEVENSIRRILLGQ